MSVIALILLVALLIPIMGIVVDSPIGRALARYWRGPVPASGKVSLWLCRCWDCAFGCSTATRRRPGHKTFRTS